MSRLTTFKPGERIRRWPVRTWNALVRQAEQSAQATSSTPPAGYGRGAPHYLSVRLLNATNTARDIGAVMGIGNDTYPQLLVDPNVVPGAEYEVPVLFGVAPLADKHKQRHAILTEAINANIIGTAAIPNAIWGRVNITDPGHDFAELDATNYRFKSSATTGHFIIAKPTGVTGEKLCVLSMGVSGAGQTTLYFGHAEDNWRDPDPHDVTVLDKHDGVAVAPQPTDQEWHNPLKLPFYEDDLLVAHLDYTNGSNQKILVILAAYNEWNICENPPETIEDGGNAASAMAYDSPSPPAGPAEDW